jgi:hypothetical protein
VIPCVSGCFLAGTPILLESGETIPVESAVPGQRFRSFAPAPAVSTLGTVHRHVAPLALELWAGGRVVRCTPSHPFYTGDGFTPAGELLPGDTVRLGGELAPAVVERISYLAGSFPVWNLHMKDGPPTFFANGFAVHNKIGGDGGFGDGDPG